MSIETQIIPIDPLAIDLEQIQIAARTLRNGGLVAFPTETVYGLGANTFDPAAVQRIFEAKQRPATDPLIVHIAGQEQLADVARTVPDLAFYLAEIFWPGPLTLIMQRHENIAANVTAGLDTVAVRIPSHPVAMQLIKAAGVGVAAPSANRFTRPSATTAQHVFVDLGGQVELIIDSGPTSIGIESTVLDLIQSPPVVLRPGGVSIEALRDILPDVQLNPRFIQEESGSAASSPGQLTRHYSPQAEVLAFSGPVSRVLARMKVTAESRSAGGQRIGILVPNEDAAAFAGLPVEIVRLGPTEDVARIGHNLFAGLRELDDRQVDVILVRTLQRDGLGLAIWDRLLRAAEGHLIEILDE
jgi:L-threonylcarbamoyladenylate synthase